MVRLVFSFISASFLQDAHLAADVLNTNPVQKGALRQKVSSTDTNRFYAHFLSFDTLWSPYEHLSASVHPDFQMIILLLVSGLLPLVPGCPETDLLSFINRLHSAFHKP